MKNDMICPHCNKVIWMMTPEEWQRMLVDNQIVNTRGGQIEKMIAAAFENIEGVMIDAGVAAQKMPWPGDEGHISSTAILRTMDIGEVGGKIVSLVHEFRSMLDGRSARVTAIPVLAHPPHVDFWPLRISGHPVRALMAYDMSEQGWRLMLDTWVH